MGDGRIATLDAVRGFAVLGILAMNIVSFGLPGYAYVDPNYAGGAEGANWWAWALAYVFADGKLRGLFTMMFGASTVLIAERAATAGESPARVHFARMFWLFVIGMIHAYLIWYGDILVLYSVCGAVAYGAWRWRPRTLLWVGVALLAFRLISGGVDAIGATRYEAAAAAPGASAATVAGWRDFRDGLAPPPESAAELTRTYRAGWLEGLPGRAGMALFIQTQIETGYIPDTIALILIGMALFRLGFFSGEWSPRAYARVLVAGIAILPLYVPLIAWIDATHFSPITLLWTEAIQLTLLRPLLSLAFASAVILAVRARPLPRLSAAGRMAFSNYLGTSIVCTLIFNGYGPDLFGRLERWQLYPVMLAVWVLILLWSKPWLHRFRYGPFEWLWRSLARGHLQSFRKAIAND